MEKYLGVMVSGRPESGKVAQLISVRRNNVLGRFGWMPYVRRWLGGAEVNVVVVD